jgi:hypothetical protein
MAISFRTSTTSAGTTITGPSTIAAGDILVLGDFSINGDGAVPSGFSSLSNVSGVSFGDTARAIVSAKRATGSEASATITGSTSPGGTPSKILLVFNAGADSINSSSFNGEAIVGNPSSQAANASGGSAPLIVVGAYGCYGGDLVNPRSFSPAKDSEVNHLGAWDAWLAYKIYNSSPANTTIDMDDESLGGGICTLQSGWIEAVNLKRAIPTFRRQTRFFTRRF